MKTLTAKREIETTGIYKGFKKTVLKNESDEVVSIYPAGNTQPSKNRKTITHNCFKYNILWENN